jgi:hypothetical protein
MSPAEAAMHPTVPTVRMAAREGLSAKGDNDGDAEDGPGYAGGGLERRR